jgi:PAS domain S-box-containing protein
MHRRAALERRHTLILIALLAVLTLGVTYATIERLYIVAMAEERSRLAETAQSQARLIEAIARSNLELDGDLAAATSTTLAVVRAAHAEYAGLGRTGEFTLARRDGDSIVFLLIQRHSELTEHAPIPFQSGLAEPMHRALSGESGTLIGRDYRGVTVLAAYEPVAVLDLGIVAKIDLAEIQGKYRDAGLLTLGPALAAIALGAFLFIRVTRPLVERIGESEQRYRDFVELMTNGLMLQDADGMIVYANDRLCEMTGRSRQSLVGRPSIELFAEDSREEVVLHVERGRAGDSETYEAVVVLAGGVAVPVLVAPRPIFGPRGAYEGSFAVLSEVTALIEAQNALQSEKERAQQYLDVVGVLVVVLDVQGRIELINRRGLEILGYEAPTDLVGCDWFSTCVPEAVRDDVRRVFAQIIAGDLRPVRRYENAVVTRDGRRRLILWHNTLLRDPEGRIRGTLSSGEDVTERRRDERALSRRAMQLEIVNDVSQRLSSILNLDELLLHVTRAVQEGFGFYHADIFLLDESREHAVFRVGSDPAGTAASRELGLRCRVGVDGMVGWVAATGEPLLAGDVSKEPRFLPDKLVPETRSELVLPISHEGRILGVLDLQSEELNAFASDDVWVMTALCGQLGAAIENARLHEAVQTSEDRYRLLLQNANDAVYVHAVTPDAPGRFFDVNDKACGMLGYTREELLTMDIPRIDVPEQAERTPAILKKLFAESRAVFETEHVAKDGRRIPVEVSVRLFDLHGVPTVLSVARDITERRRAEAALRESEAKYRSLFENAVLGVYLTAPDGRILAANPALTSMLGYETFDELAARDLEAEGYHPEYPRSTFKERLDKEGYIVGLESAWTRKGGSTVYVRENAAAIRDDDGQILFYEGTVEDITQRREMEEAKLELEARLRQNQRLESIGTLASGVAHEINNPLTGIINYAQLIVDRTDDDSLREFARGIVDEGNRVAEIVKNLLSFSRQSRESHSPARVADLVTTSLSLIGAALRKDGIQIDVEVPGDLPSIKCRSQQIQQVLLNLLTNARDGLNARYPGYDKDKIVRVSAEKVNRDGRTWIRLVVEDRGAGIPASIVGRVFDPFFTTKPRDQGTGLGLSISYGIVRDHHGTLTVESVPNQSTRFLAELPVDNGWDLSPPARGAEGGRRA